MHCHKNKNKKLSHSTKKSNTELQIDAIRCSSDLILWSNKKTEIAVPGCFVTFFRTYEPGCDTRGMAQHFFIQH